MINIDPENVPRHVAVIMDGNGRWAKRQGMPRIRGHQIGVERVEEIMRVAPEIGIKYLTLYAFSRENWNRPKEEVSFLMQLLASYLDQKLEEMKRNNVVFNVIGRIEDMPSLIRQKVLRNMDETRENTGLVATFAFSYSSRLEITDACRAIAEKVKNGDIDPAAIDEAMVENHLYTKGLPDPDLMIRTSGELRISNFLLWQLSYTELYITDKCWPEFTGDELRKAVQEYQSRERRFGLTEPAGGGNS